MSQFPVIRTKNKIRRALKEINFAEKEHAEHAIVEALSILFSDGGKAELVSKEAGYLVLCLRDLYATQMQISPREFLFVCKLASEDILSEFFGGATRLQIRIDDISISDNSRNNILREAKQC